MGFSYKRNGQSTNEKPRGTSHPMRKLKFGNYVSTGVAITAILNYTLTYVGFLLSSCQAFKEKRKTCIGDGVNKSLLGYKFANWTEAVGLKLEEAREKFSEQNRVFLRQLLLQLLQVIELGGYIRGQLDRVHETRELFPRSRVHHSDHC